MNTFSAGLATAAASVLAVACSSEARDRSAIAGGGADAGASGASSSAPAPFAADAAPPPVTSTSACATASAGATRPPVRLVFMYDRSISMGFQVGGSGSATTVWDACRSGFVDFFSAPSSAGIHASLSFFGKDDTLDSSATCSATSYATPDVPMTALPNATSFSNAIAATHPFTGTPTLPALTGALQYAAHVKQGLGPGEKVAVVLVTDGAPTGCTSENTVQGVHDAAAQAAKAGIPTYVVGIGKVQNLQTIASGGGTTAILVDTSTPSQITTDLEAALGQVGAAVLGCEYVLPAPPQGQALDVNAVNVTYTPANGAAATYAYSADCADARGWHYDDVQSPNKVIACPGLCSTLQADQGGRVDIVFGCTTTVAAGGSLPK